MDENEKKIEDTLKRIGIDYAANTKKAIATIIGEEPQASVLDELVRKNLPALEKGKNESQGYLYGIVKKLLETEYHGVKLKLEAERAERERMLEERRKYPPSILEDCFRRAEAGRHEEGIGDISALLDDDDDDEVPVSSGDSSSARQMLAEMRRLRKAEQDDDDDDAPVDLAEILDDFFSDDDL